MCARATDVGLALPEDPSRFFSVPAAPPRESHGVTPEFKPTYSRLSSEEILPTPEAGASGADAPDPAQLSELLGHVSTLTNQAPRTASPSAPDHTQCRLNERPSPAQVRQRNAHQALVRLRETRPELVRHPQTFVRVYELLSTYKFKLPVRRFLHDLLEPAACTYAGVKQSRGLEHGLPGKTPPRSASAPARRATPQEESFARTESVLSGQL